MALPNGYTIHFRYRFTHLGLDLDKIDDLKAQKCVIFFSCGNDLKNPKPRINYSLREAIIEDIKKNDDTGLVHFYLKLQDFKEFEIQPNQESIIPPIKFASELEVLEKKPMQWHEIINNIKESFKDQLMYKFNFTEKDSNKEIAPKFDIAKSVSYYSLEDESSYSLNIAFYDTSDPNENKYQNIQFEQSGELLKINAPSTIEIGALRDNISYNVYTNSMNFNNTFTFLNFTSRTTNSAKTIEENYNVPIQVQIKKNRIRSFEFAGYSVLALISAGLGKMIADKIDINGVFNLKLTGLMIVAIILGLFAAYNLYSLFNKK